MYINSGFHLWGAESYRIELLQKRAIRLITNSSYTAHTTPLFIELGLLKVQDMFKLKLLKFYYKLSSNLLPQYFVSYRDVINSLKANKMILFWKKYDLRVIHFMVFLSMSPWFT